jgi:hypothetical protein
MLDSVIQVLHALRSTNDEKVTSVEMNREKRDAFEQFLLAEYNNIANAHFNTVDAIANFIKNYIVIASVPFVVLGLVLNDNDKGSNWLRDALTAHPMTLGWFMTALSTVGLLVMMYVTNIRCDAILYARVVNGVRNYFYARSSLDELIANKIRVLPTTTTAPKFFEPLYFGSVVLIFSLVGTAYFALGWYFVWDARNYSMACYWVMVVGFFALHLAVYASLAALRERQTRML